MIRAAKALATVTPNAKRVDDGWECPRGEQRRFMSLLGYLRRGDRRCTRGAAIFRAFEPATQRAVARYFAAM